MNVVFLSLDQVLRIHCHQIEAYGGSGAIRDLGLLESALETPASGLGEDYFHKGIHEMAAAYLFHITQNHPFVDGNKRVGAACCGYFLYLNGFELDADPDAFADLVLAVAAGKADKKKAAGFLKKHSRPA
jgi:death on curing protein